MNSSRIKITQTIHRDNEHDICFDCREPVIVEQFHCNCGCDEVYCQPCFLKHYKNFAMHITLQRFRKGTNGIFK
jgi:predicted sulfurtransferase